MKNKSSITIVSLVALILLAGAVYQVVAAASGAFYCQSGPFGNGCDTTADQSIIARNPQYEKPVWSTVWLDRVNEWGGPRYSVELRNRNFCGLDDQGRRYVEIDGVRFTLSKDMRTLTYQWVDKSMPPPSGYNAYAVGKAHVETACAPIDESQFHFIEQSTATPAPSPTPVLNPTPDSYPFKVMIPFTLNRLGVE
jgi:hypothetical protein